MTVREVILLARTGELLQLSPTIRDSDDFVVGAINLGLVEIYKRFTLRTDEAIVTLKNGKTVYKLDGTDPDVQMGDSKYMYLVAAYEDGDDTSDYTTDDVSLPINVEDDLYSINTITYNSIQVPLIIEGAIISCIYASQPFKATTADLDAEIDLPDQFIECLLHYVGYRGQGAMDANIQAESNTHYMRFEAACNKVKELGVGITGDDLNMDARINTRGFI